MSPLHVISSFFQWINYDFGSKIRFTPPFAINIITPLLNSSSVGVLGASFTVFFNKALNTAIFVCISPNLNPVMKGTVNTGCVPIHALCA